MNAIFKKLNYKDQKQLFILNAPKSFEQEMNEMKRVTAIKSSIASAKEIEFFLAFVTKQKEVDNHHKNDCIDNEGRWIAVVCLPERNIKKIYV